MYRDYYFKDVDCTLDGYMYMMKDATVVDSSDLTVADNEDVDAAIHYGWDKDEILSITGFLLTPELKSYIDSKFDD